MSGVVNRRDHLVPRIPTDADIIARLPRADREEAARHEALLLGGG
jgi:hypothetical protein